MHDDNEESIRGRIFYQPTWIYPLCVVEFCFAKGEKYSFQNNIIFLHVYPNWLLWH